MKKLVGITFNGIDRLTDLQRLQEIQKKYPLSEFGVLLSENWENNGNRYYNPKELYKLKRLNLNLSAHLCGRLARKAIRNDFIPVQEFCEGYFDIFQRIQINIVKYGNKNPKKLVLNLPSSLNEAIIQQESADNCDLFMNYYNSCNDDSSISILIDGSGGQGLDNGINILDTTAKVGYAGGINEENVIEKLDYLMNHTQNFWIDMESGVRTNDWFDLEKVQHICEMVYNYLNINK